MMKTCLLLLALPLGISTLAAQERGNIDSLAKVITSEFQTVESASKALLDALPEEFDEFVGLWGYDGPLYDSPSLVSYLYQSRGDIAIDRSLLAKKLISLTYGAYWQADHVNFLLMIIQDMLRSDLSLILTNLTKVDTLHNKEFWRFIFSGIHPENLEDLRDEILNRINRNSYRYPYVHMISEEYDYNVKHPVR